MNKLHIEIIRTIHKNGNSMLESNFKSKFGFDDVGFLNVLAELEGIIKSAHGSKSFKNYVSLTKEGIKLAKKLD